METVRSELGPKAICEINESGEYMLCYILDDPMMDPRRKAYMVMSTAGEVILPVKRVNGDVTWASNTEIELTVYPRIVDKRSDQGPKKEIVSIIKK